MNTLQKPAKLISVQDCQWYTFTVFGIGVPACSQTCSKYTSRACSYRAYTGVAVVAQVQVRVNLCKHRENTRFYKHHLLVERAGSSESRQTAYIATWLQGWDCCCRVTQHRIETWCKNLQDKCPFATVQFIYLVWIYIYIHHRHKTTTYILFLVKKGNAIWDSRNHCFTMIKNPSCSNKCFSPLTYLKGSCVWPQSRDNFVTSN